MLHVTRDLERLYLDVGRDIKKEVPTVKITRALTTNNEETIGKRRDNRNSKQNLFLCQYLSEED